MRSTARPSKSTVCVRQPWGLAACFFAAGALFAALLCWAAEGFTPYSLIPAVPTWLLGLYYARWRAEFGAKTLTVRRIFRTRSYGYGEIATATEYRAGKSSELELKFTDGRKFSVPRHCAKFEAARNTLVRHVSVTVKDF